MASLFDHYFFMAGCAEEEVCGCTLPIIVAGFVVVPSLCEYDMVASGPAYWSPNQVVALSDQSGARNFNQQKLTLVTLLSYLSWLWISDHLLLIKLRTIMIDIWSDLNTKLHTRFWIQIVHFQKVGKNASEQSVTNIFECIGHKYLLGHSFVSIFILRLYSDIHSYQICLNEYIRTFVRECVRV